MRKKISLLLLLIFSLMFVAFDCVKAEGGILYLSPKNGIYKIGSTFSIKVMLDSGGSKINAADGVLNFDPTQLEVVTISKTNSIFNFWTTEPTFDNSKGVIEFAGGTSQKFIGKDGIVVSITFKALANATANVNFSVGSILAADGKATNILTEMQNGIYDLEPRVVIPASKRSEEPLMIPEGAPMVPTVFSPTHSNEDAWYSNKNPEFFWETQTDVLAIRLSLDKEPISVPMQEYNSSVKEKKFENIEDGIWYFHIRFKNQYGWGEIAHRKVLIDTTPPQTFQINIDNEGDTTNPSPVLYFETQDTLSGIESYEIKIDNTQSVRVKEDTYKLPAQMPGSHIVIIKAFDRADNFTIGIKEFVISPIHPPVIKEYPKTDRVGEALTIKGTSLYPEGIVTIFIKKEKGNKIEERNVKTDENGNWIFVYDKRLEEGIYQIWAEITDKRGAKSTSTDKITVIVTLPFLLKIGKVVIDYLTVIVTLSGLIAILLLIIFYTHNRIKTWRRRLRKETKEIAQSVVKAFKVLEREIQEEVENLDKKPGLSVGEKEIYDRLKKALKNSKEIIGKEIKDVEEELK